MIAELGAQVPDVYVDDVLIAVPAFTPHLAYELPPGEFNRSVIEGDGSRVCVNYQNPTSECENFRMVRR